ncbi:MAG: bifunctional hydroxymethylpyrimidine kinase/phosphomethylpyrimidine kinase [Acidobacteriota bacterium]|nr:bifunctional hydroxymethylpyrimidine kinase/phosphomethylpyrimidine kinase [Acidobacteriota bacterium]
MARNPPVALTIAGSDSGGGAGIQADLKAFAANGAFGTTVVTAVTAQSTAAVLGVQVLDADFVELQLRAVLEDLPVAAVKTGMLGSSAVVAAVTRWAAAGRLPRLVVDPVLHASTGRPLLDEGAVAAYRDLLPHALVVTPNMQEAATLTGAPVTDVAGMARAGQALAESGAGVVVVKGGHLEGPAVDVVVADGVVRELRRDRVATRNDHGTGCSLSAALTARLAAGAAPLDALEAAKSYVTTAIAGAAGWRLGAGHGPLDHFGWGAGVAG